MEGTYKKRLLFFIIIVLGILVNRLSIALFIESGYVLKKISLATASYLGGIFWAIIAIKISKFYIEKNSMEETIVNKDCIQKISLKNSLTDIPNGIALEKRFKAIMENKNENNFKILFIDVDGFKIVNDTLGYEYGDETLKSIAKRIKENTDENCQLFHIRGDEFVLLITNDYPLEKVCYVAEKIIKSMVRPFVYNKKEVHLTISIGIAIYPLGGTSINMLLQSARIAVQIAKESGKNTYKVYESSMNIKMNKKLELINSLHKAVEKEEFILHYQPQIDSLTNKIVGLEALIRWENPEMGVVSPAEFIPLAEETGLIIPIGDWVLKTACAQNKQWQMSGYSSVPVAVNISAIQFQEPMFVDKVVNALQEASLDPKWLHLEITESVAIKDTDLTISILDRLQEIGVKIALDDFGTGFSSLGYLNKFKINVLKIDSSFIKDIKKDEFTITKTIIVLGKSLNMEIVAEGVETNEQLDYLREAGCDKIQGYLFSRPVTPNEIEKMLYIL